ncbi:MAG: 30S ribosomal protein S3 [Firmicutes bacterium]|nr:30S ribosomal protein S3 [Bacillota bacterium]
MGQKVNPHGFRVGVIRDWDSRWYASKDKFGDTLVSDFNIRKQLKAKLYAAGVPKIEIERANGRVKIVIHCAKPGLVIGPKGAAINELKTELEGLLGMPVSISVVEIRQIDLDAQLVAESIADQIERRIGFRRAMKQSIARSMKAGAKGVKVLCSGRLGGAEIARSEHYHEGSIPLQTLRADIDYGFAEAKTTYGKIGVKVWIYKGEVLPEIQRTASERQSSQRDRRSGDRNDRGDRRRGDRRNGDRRGGDRRGGNRSGGYRDGNRGDGNRGGYRDGGNRGGYRGDSRRTENRDGAAPKEGALNNHVNAEKS